MALLRRYSPGKAGHGVVSASEPIHTGRVRRAASVSGLSRGRDSSASVGWGGRGAGDPASERADAVGTAAQPEPIRPAMMLVTMTEVIVTVEKPATIIFGRISCSMAATSSGLSPAPLAASWDRIIVPGKP